MSRTSFFLVFFRVIEAATLTLLLMPVKTQGDQQCNDYQSDSRLFLPGDSCEDIYNKNPRSRDDPGYYWILHGPSRVYCGMSYTSSSCEQIYINNAATRDKPGYYRITNNVWVYCNMVTIGNAFSRGDLLSSCAGVGGVWNRIGGFNIAVGDGCPSPWVKSSHNGVSFCIPASTAAGCYSVIYSTNGMRYQKVCGRASGYQKASPDAFNRITDVFDYFEGLSITHGSPRQHIWTYAVGVTDSRPAERNCPCSAYPGSSPPSFVGSHYYCESGATTSWSNVYYLSDVLWDGAGCSAGNTCCSDPNLPWFYRHLSQVTQDDIEVRMCMDEDFDNEAVLITNLELYVQ